MHTLLEWRWHVDAFNKTRAGIVAAVQSAEAANSFTLHGVMATKHLPFVACSINGHEQWARASATTAIPESDYDPQTLSARYRHRWPQNAGPVENDNGLVGVRFTCNFPTLAAIDRETHLLVRVKLAGIELWRIENIRMHCPGYPIVGSITPRKHAFSLPSLTPSVLGRSVYDGLAKGEDAKSEVTVCVQYVYGTGYSLQAVLEFTAWYLLLGVRRIVIFDSMEPELEVGEARQQAARERMLGLQKLSAALGDRFIIARGLATWDMMRRTRTHMNAQSLAGNMCKAAVGGLAASASGGDTSTTPPAQFVALLDLDEYLTPPAEDASVPGRVAMRLSGSLRRLADYVTSGDPVTAQYLRDSRAARSRVHNGIGSHRCLSFASAYYLPPPCGAGGSDASNSSITTGMTTRGWSGGWGGQHSISTEDPLPAMLQRSWRTPPDNFERGPSHTWRTFLHWNFFVRSKFLVEAGDDKVLTGNHECCCRAAGSFGKQCSTRSGLVANHSCATVEFMPLELWHIRHLQGGGLSTNVAHRAPCRNTGPVQGVIATNGTRKRVSVMPEATSFPSTWGSEYVSALSTMSRLLAFHRETF